MRRAMAYLILLAVLRQLSLATEDSGSDADNGKIFISLKNGKLVCLGK